MGIDHVVGVIAACGLAGYLAWALMRPDRF
jgi:K+-transporting ATPase KdpF subunit